MDRCRTERLDGLKVATGRQRGGPAVPSRMRATGYRKQRSESRHEKQGAPLAISETQRNRAACKRLRAMTISQKLRCGHPALCVQDRLNTRYSDRSGRQDFPSASDMGQSYLSLRSTRVAFSVPVEFGSFTKVSEVCARQKEASSRTRALMAVGTARSAAMEPPESCPSWESALGRQRKFTKVAESSPC
jgi:hypothetical protein